MMATLARHIAHAFGFVALHAEGAAERKLGTIALMEHLAFLGHIYRCRVLLLSGSGLHLHRRTAESWGADGAHKRQSCNEAFCFHRDEFLGSYGRAEQGEGALGRRVRKE